MPWRRHLGLVVEDATEMISTREHFVLIGQIGAAAIHKIDAGQPVLQRDFLGAQMLLYGHRKIGAAFDRGVIGDDHALASRNTADAGDQTCRGSLAAIETMRGELADLQKGRNRINQRADAIARQQFSPRKMSLARGLPPSETNPIDRLVQVRDELPHRLGV
jgi:hypothetical protein